jgi:osmotically-inducible protein OsmY
MSNQVKNDDEIKKRIQEHLSWDNRIDGLGIHVKVSNGKVTLTGQVSSYCARRAAESDARSIEGVTSVDNQLDIPYSQNVDVRGDGLLKSDVEKILDCNSDIDANNIDVAVSAGQVTLDGHVDAYWKKVMAAQLVSNISGVIRINNKLSVVPYESVSDEIIARDVVEALERNVNVDPRSVTVKVENGKVTLSGFAPNLAASRAAVEMAHYTSGVKDVVDQIVMKQNS